MRLIDADLLKGRFIHGRFDDVYISEKEVQDAPTVDAVKVVRCGECKYWHEVDSVEGTTFGECKHPHPIIRKSVFLHEGWFCADGERRE